MTSMPDKYNAPDIIKALFIVIVTFVVYIRAIHGGFIWDDQTFIVENRFLLDLDGLWSIWFTTDLSHQYYPLASTIFWIERHIFGLNPIGYHTLNIALHSINALLVWVACRRLKLGGAYAIALIFSLHPVHIDSVAFVNEMKNLVSGLFYLLALLSFLTFEEKGSKRWYALTLLAFVLALLSKTVAGTLPAALLIIRWMRHKDIGPGYILRLVPFFIIAAAFAVVTIAVEVENTGVDIGISFAQRLLVAGRASWFYATKLIYPMKLSFIYPRFTPDITSLTQWAYPLGVVALTLLLFGLRKRLTRAPVAAVAFFLVTIFPALGFVDINFFNYSYVADHFQYLASLALIALAVGVICRLIKNLPGPVAYITAISIVFILGVLTLSRLSVTTNHELLWRDTIKKNPASWAAHNNFGNLLFAQKRIPESIKEFQMSISINPYSEKARGNLANALTETGRFDEAIDQYEAALRITPDNPLTLINIGINYTLQNKFEEAVRKFERSIELNPYDSYAFYNYALALTGLNRAIDAERAYLKAIELNPADTDSRNNLANIYMDKNDLDRAMALYTEVIELLPTHARANNNLGIIMSIRKEYELSLSYFEVAIKADPEYADAHYNFAITLEDIGRHKEALEKYQAVLRLEPDHAETNNNIGSILLKEGDHQAAKGYFQQALRLDPSSPIYKKNLEIADKLTRGDRARGLKRH